MSDTSSNNSENSYLTTDDLTWGKYPCVQYGFPEDKGPIRAPQLQTIFDPIPEDATTASPVYILTADEYEDQANRENPYRVKGYTSVATKVQGQCEADNLVYYPVHVESDKLREVGPATVEGWLRKFVEDYIGVPYDTCTVYYSGNRSIHVHVPRFVKGNHQLSALKELAETFCEETGAELDCGVYKPKQMFRLPGVEHEKTGVPKVEIDGEWDNTRLAHKVNEANPTVPGSYAEVLQRVFVSQDSVTVNDPRYSPDDPRALFLVLDYEKAVLNLLPDQREIETPLIEQVPCPTDPVEIAEWARYNAKEFSPYALASGNGRSVAVVQVKGTPFARKDVRNGAPLVPVYFYGARGCAGEEFTKAEEHGPLQLSKADYRKWEKHGFEPDDHIVIIGGQSRSSIIFRVGPGQATIAGKYLAGEDGRRSAALDYLQSEGYETGEAGGGGKATTSKRAGTQGRRRSTSRTGEETEAARLQGRAERDGIGTLGFREVSNVANRLLRIGGWPLAWEWLEEQYGEQFHPGNTWTRLKGIVEYYDDLDVEVPAKPR